MRDLKKQELERIEKMKQKIEEYNDSYWKNLDKIKKSEKKRMAKLTKEERINWRITDIMIKANGVTKGIEELIKEIKQ